MPTRYYPGEIPEDQLAARLADHEATMLHSGDIVSVPEGHRVSLWNEANMGCSFGPGEHLITLEDIPLADPAGQSFQIFFTKTGDFTFAWETRTRMAVHSTGIIAQLAATGSCTYTIENPTMFALSELQDESHAERETVEREIARWMLPQALSDAFESLPEVSDPGAMCEPLAEALMPLLAEAVGGSGGLGIVALSIDSVSL